MTLSTRRGRRLAVMGLTGLAGWVGLACLAGVALVVAGVVWARPAAPAVVEPRPAVGAAGSGLSRELAALQDRLRTNPEDAAGWARLGGGYVEQARATGDPSWYTRAQGALDRSMALRPQGNGLAMIGLGALANARHDFASARSWALRAAQELPDTAEVYGVLADALTQLGEAAGATEAVQRMLDLKPAVASFTRASYDLELHGRLPEAGTALHRALDAATNPDDVTFCRYYLGELAFNAGDLDEARRQYSGGLAVAPSSAALRAGSAKVAAARGATDEALADYREVVAAVPLPQYLQEYAALLTAAGRPAEAAAQYALLADQQRLAEAAGATDDLTAASVAADRGDAAEALRRASAEWGRRQHVLVADAMAWALHLSGRDAEALGFADRAAALGTRDASFLYHRGLILRGLGRVGEAAAALEQALAVNPYFSPVHAPAARQALDGLRGRR